MSINFQTEPSKYRHWRMEFNGEIANLIMDVDENAGLFEGYELKLNSYDLGVDIELYDALQRLRFEHPEVRTVIVRSAKERVFSAGANIRMLAGSSHDHKVNFCKFTNETRNSMEDASRNSGQKFIAAVTGACAGGGYELALACDHILLTDDGSSSVSLPEVPLLAVLPGTGGITRVTDKRKVRRDRADIFCSTEEGIKGDKAVQWRLVDEAVVNSKFDQRLSDLAEELALSSDRPQAATSIELTPLDRRIEEDKITYSSISVDIDRARRIATMTVNAEGLQIPENIEELIAMGDQYWGIKTAREFDDALLHLRFNETEIGIIQFRSLGSIDTVLAHDTFLEANAGHWLVREILLNWARVLRRIDLTSRSLITLIEPGSCFAGSLGEIAFASDRVFMTDGEFEDWSADESTIALNKANFGRYLMCNGLSRLQTRFLGEPDSLVELEQWLDKPIDAAQADQLGLITYAYDDIDWDDEIRIFLEERASFSPDAMVGLEANLRFAGPETMESKIFGRLTAWQNWIFQRPNAAGEQGALQHYGTGKKAVFDPRRI